MRVIAICGKKGVGKNFTTDRARELIGKASLVDDGFAVPFKEFIINILGLPREAIYGNDADKNALTQYRWEQIPECIKPEQYKNKTGFMTIRHVMQVFGTEIIRKIFDDLAWVKALMRKIEQARASGTEYFFITDTRFVIEVEHIQSIGGEVWFVDGPRRNENGELEEDLHSSETELDIIRNMPNIKIIDNSPGQGPEGLKTQIRQLLNGSL